MARIAGHFDPDCAGARSRFGRGLFACLAGALIVAELGHLGVGEAHRSIAVAEEPRGGASKRDRLRAGAAAIDISPTTLPAIQNGGFLERTADRVLEPLHSRALVLSAGDESVVIAVVDSCMLPLEVCDEVKDQVKREVGLDRERILIAATHTHSAPGVMDYCLGSRADAAYSRQLPPLIARSIIEAMARREPAEIAFAVASAPDHTAVRRWIRRQDRPDLDPFGERTVRAMMHPGFDSADHVGPSGPEDPDLSIVAVRALDGRPIALLANYAMHYFGVGGGFSPDYFGRFARAVAARLAPGDERFVGMLSQGTSGDIWRRDYSGRQESNDADIDTYTGQLVALALEAIRDARYSAFAPIAVQERRERFRRRVPDADRLEWAKRVLPDRSKRPETREEVYAEQAFYLHEHPDEEVVLQGLRVGEICIAAIPCEVYALTGLEIKARSPLPSTFVMELANGASGYIPPPEQHALGGYNTWPARTAGLEVDAEPKIVAMVLALLEVASKRPQREPIAPLGARARAILARDPWAFWRLEEYRGVQAADASGSEHPGRIEPRVAFHLDGPLEPGPPEPGLLSREDPPNRCLQLAGGNVSVDLDDETFRDGLSVELWIWNGVVRDEREVHGTVLCRGRDELLLVRGADGEGSVLALGEGRGRTPIHSREWRHVALISAGGSRGALKIYLDGKLELEAPSRVEAAPDGTAARLTIGGGSAKAPSLEGRVDDIAIYPRALTPQELTP